MAWDIAADWNTGDINTRVTNACAILDNAGTPFIIAQVQHGVKCYDTSGTLQWTYTGITNGYDVREIITADLTGSGHNDCVIIASGFNNATSTGFVGIVDKNGTQLQLLSKTDFATTLQATYGVAVDGTDIYISTNYGITKFVKSGSTWSEDTTNWNKSHASTNNGGKVAVADMGNGKRVYHALGGYGIYCYQTNGTQDWFNNIGNHYNWTFEIGTTDSSKTGKQMAVPIQSGFYILDKDGNTSQDYTTNGTNVRSSVTLYDNDGDGEDEIYYSDMGGDVWCIERTGTDTYGLKYSLLDSFTTAQVAQLAHYDINDDGDDEIFIATSGGHVLIYDKTLGTQLKDLNIAHGTAGGFLNESVQFMGQRGIVFEDIDGDGHADMVVSGSTGYVDVYLTSGFSAGALEIDPSLVSSTPSVYAPTLTTRVTITPNMVSRSPTAYAPSLSFPNSPPTTALDTPTDAGSVTSTTPSLTFTGTDPDSDSMIYELELDTVNTFDSQSGSPLLDKLSSTDAGFSD